MTCLTLIEQETSAAAGGAALEHKLSVNNRERRFIASEQDMCPEAAEEGVIGNEDVICLAQNEQARALQVGDTTPMQRKSHEILDPEKKRYCHLDVVRTLCVFLVAIDHSNWRYSQKNVMWSQSWVLQLLWVVSGICFALNPQPLRKQLPRLLLIFVIGVSFNWLAYVIRDFDWKGSPGNVVFQFYFIIGLMIFATAATPAKRVLLHNFASLGRLRAHQRGRSTASEGGEASKCFMAAASPAADSSQSLGTGLWGFSSTSQLPRTLRSDLFKFLLTFFLILGVQVALGIWCSLHRSVDLSTYFDKVGLGFWASGLNASELLGQIVFSICLGVLVCCEGLFLRAESQSKWVAWVLLAYIYVCRIFIIPLLYGQTAFGRQSAGFGLYLTGLTAASQGMAGAMTIRRYLLRYWFFIAFALSLLWSPTWSVRFDEHPPEDILTNWRVVTSEFICVITFLVAGESFFDERIYTEDHASWLGDFGLLLFVVHWAVHLVVPHPWNWVVLGALAAACWWRKRRHAFRAPSSTSTPEAKPTLECAAA